MYEELELLLCHRGFVKSDMCNIGICLKLEKSGVTNYVSIVQVKLN